MTRISYNSEHWVRPTGDARSQESADTYNSQMGFGHEDWLFRNEWLLDGWRYAFLQGVNKSHAKLVREQQAFDVTLFTVLPDKSRRYVARISDVECLDDTQADLALDAIRQNGWFDVMASEVAAVGGNVDALVGFSWSRHVVNVRFKMEKVAMLDLPILIGDPAMSLQRYMLYGSSAIGGGGWIAPRRLRRVGTNQAPNQTPYLRGPTGPIEVCPEHSHMQDLLLNQLRAEYPDAHIVCEEDFVDIAPESVASGARLIA